jgi:hypothetical protein
MSVTSETLDRWFTYHPPTAETAPKYKAIIEACDDFAKLVVATFNKEPPTYDQVNAAARHVGEVFLLVVPDCADRAAAFRSLRLARNATNEILAGFSALPHRPDMLLLGTAAIRSITEARWQANAAIALGGA